MDRHNHSTRLYRIDKTVRQAVGGTSAAFALPELSDMREVRIACTQNAYLLFGDNTATATTSALPVFAGIPEVLQVPASATHFAVIQDSAAGNISLTPVG